MGETEWGPVSNEEWRRVVRSGARRGIQEIRSGAIIPDPPGSGFYRIEANTAEGLRRFRQAEEEACIDVQSERMPVVLEGAYVSDVPTQWWPLATHGWPAQLLWSWVELAPAEEREKREERGARSHVTIDELSPDASLARLEDAATSDSERRRIVIEAEVLPFGPNERSRLSVVLHRFIEEHRNSDDPEDLVAVASAIRKYVATMHGDGLGALAVLLASDQNATVPLEVELEVAKTLVRKLTSQPPEGPDSEPELADRLMELASAYLNARLLSREKYGAVALNVVLALLLLRSRHVADLLRLLSNLRVPWFTQLVVRRASRVRDDFERRFPVAQAQGYVTDLNALCEEFATTEA